VNTVAESKVQPNIENEVPRSLKEWVIVLVIAVALTYAFFPEIWGGGGIIGGDLFTYFMPQKQFLAERLQAGEFPLWNNRTSFGYPVVAESQTGGLYLPHFLLYRTLDINTAYNANQLLHYVATFVFAWLFVREIGIKPAGACLAALVYTYGWFPSRLCLEWAIIGGCYLPLLLWLMERFLKTCHWRYLVYGSLAIALQLSAGHYNLAFISQLTLVCYVPARLWFWRENLHEKIESRKVAAIGLVGAAIAVGFLLAAAKLLPTWELKRISQRENITIEGEFDPGYGHIPPAYIHQSVLGIWPHLRNLEEPGSNPVPEPTLPGSNRVEAHLYFGALPLVMLVGLVFLKLTHLAASVLPQQKRAALREILPPNVWLSRRNLVWLLLSILAVIYATGLFLPITKHLPGFSFFRGPGRYGIVTTLGFGILAGSAFTFLFDKNRFHAFLIACVFLVTVADLLIVYRVVTFSTILPGSPLRFVEDSPVRQIVQRTPQARLFAPGANLPNLLGVSSVPEYLGIGPAEYYDEKFDPPELKVLDDDVADWAKRHGVTHLLVLEPVPLQTDQLRLVFAYVDPFLNRVWARSLDPLFLFEVVDSPGRVIFADEDSANSAEITKYDANVVEIKVEVAQATDVALTDLIYPGWEVEVDDQPAKAKRHAGLFRAVEVPAGKHTIRWTFRPIIQTVGAVISGLALLLLLGVGHVRYWKYGNGAARAKSKK
jgi:hypothetical protein